MSDEINFSYNIHSTWSIIKVIREKVESLVAERDKNLAYACKMTSSELVENAVKYGCAIDDDTGIGFNFTLGKKEATIQVRNGVIHVSDFENVKRHINEISGSENPHDLYLKRLSILMEEKKVRHSQLGLYRIAYEGEFKLTYKYDNKKNILTVTAKKSI